MYYKVVRTKLGVNVFKNPKKSNLIEKDESKILNLSNFADYILVFTFQISYEDYI